MTIMPFEGLMSETIEDAASIIIAFEPTHTDADEQFYCDSILSGEYDEQEADYGDWAEATYDSDFDGYEADRAADRWERAYWND